MKKTILILTIFCLPILALGAVSYERSPDGERPVSPISLSTSYDVGDLNASSTGDFAFYIVETNSGDVWGNSLNYSTSTGATLEDNISLTSETEVVGVRLVSADSSGEAGAVDLLNTGRLEGNGSDVIFSISFVLGFVTSGMTKIFNYIDIYIGVLINNYLGFLFGLLIILFIWVVGKRLFYKFS